MQEGNKKLKLRKDIGSGVSVQTVVSDTSRIYVDVGLGFFAEATLTEALSIMTARVDKLLDQRNKDQAGVTKIESHIKLVQDSLQALKALSWHVECQLHRNQ